MLKGGVMDAGRIPGRTMMRPYNLPLSFLARVLFFHIDTFRLRDSHIPHPSMIISRHSLRPHSSPYLPIATFLYSRLLLFSTKFLFFITGIVDIL